MLWQDLGPPCQPCGLVGSGTGCLILAGPCGRAGAVSPPETTRLLRAIVRTGAGGFPSGRQDTRHCVEGQPTPRQSGDSCLLRTGPRRPLCGRRRSLGGVRGFSPGARGLDGCLFLPASGARGVAGRSGAAACPASCVSSPARRSSPRGALLPPRPARRPARARELSAQDRWAGLGQVGDRRWGPALTTRTGPSRPSGDVGPGGRWHVLGPAGSAAATRPAAGLAQRPGPDRGWVAGCRAGEWRLGRSRTLPPCPLARGLSWLVGGRL